MEPGLVHIIDDDEAVRAGLESLIRSVGGEARTYSSVDEFVGTALPDVPSCLLLDVRLPGTNGLDFQSSLRRLGMFLPVILMTGYGDIQMSVRGMKAGAIDFLTKPIRHQDLLDAISAALARDPQPSRGDREDHGHPPALRHPDAARASGRRLVTAGKMNKQIAGELRLSEITVKIHRGAAMRKMGIRSLAELVKMVEALRLAQSGPASANAH